MSSDKHSGLKLGVTCLVFGGGFLHSGFRRIRRAREAQDTSRSKISTAPQGLVELQGYVWPLEKTQTSLISGRPVVYRMIRVEERRGSGKNRHWVEICRDVYNPHFMLFDGTGSVVVKLDNDELELRSEGMSWWSLKNEVRESFQAQNPGALSKIPRAKGFFTNDLRVTEQCLAMGSPVYLRGNFLSDGAQETDVPAGFEIFRQKVLQLEQKEGFRLTMLDSNKDGVVTEEEAISAMASSAQVARRSAYQIAAGAEGPGQTYQVDVATIYGECSSNESHKLYIADCHEELLLRRIGSNNGLRIAGGICLLGVGAAAIAAEFFHP